MPLMSDGIEIPVTAVDQASTVFHGISRSTDAFNDSLLKLIQREKDLAADKAVKEHFDVMSQSMKDEIYNASKVTDGLENQKSVGSEAFSALQAGTIAFNQGLELVNKTMEYARKAYEATVGEAVKYGQEVQQLSILTGTSTEASSRLLDVFDKFGVTLPDLETAMRKMTTNGLSPTIEQIGILSDQYKAIQDPIQKDQFLLDNFGRSGFNMSLVLSQGSDELKKLNDQTESSLVLTQQQIDATQKNVIATKEFNDAIEAQKVAIGNQLMPVVTDALSSYAKWQGAMDEAGKKLDTNDQRTKIFVASLNLQSQAIEDSTQATIFHSEAEQSAAASTEYLTTKQKKLLDNTKEISDALKTHISLIQSMQGAEDSYEKNAKSLADKRIALEAEKTKLLSQGYSEQSQKIQDINTKLQENSDASADNAKQHDLDSKKIILGYLEQQLAAGGLTDKEVAFLMRKGKEWGIYSDQVVKDTLSAEAEVKKYTDLLNKIPGHINTILDLRTMYGDDTRATGNTPHAKGGSFIIPPGFENEGFRMPGGNTASSGEMVTITPNNGRAGNNASMNYDTGGGNKTINVNVTIAGGITDPQAAALQLQQTFQYLLRTNGVLTT